MGPAWKIAVLACTASGGLLLARQASGQYSQADVEVGFSLYNSHCFICHGADGDGVPGVNLRSGQFRRVSSDGDLNRIIQTGIPGTAMPPGAFTTSELAALVAYVRSMHDFEARAAGRGDAGRGRAVFEGKGECASCHRVNGNGSRVGPDLSEIGAVRSPEALARSLVDPTASMLPLNRYVRAVTREGQVIRGRRLNEDTYTVQLITTEERLVSLLKADLAEYAVEKTSAMPSYKDKLAAAELEDLVAYLRTLKRWRQP